MPLITFTPKMPFTWIPERPELFDQSLDYALNKFKSEVKESKTDITRDSIVLYPEFFEPHLKQYYNGDSTNASDTSPEIACTYYHCGQLDKAILEFKKICKRTAYKEHTVQSAYRDLMATYYQAIQNTSDTSTKETYLKEIAQLSWYTLQSAHITKPNYVNPHEYEQDHHDRGVFYFKQAQYDKAEESFKKAIKVAQTITARNHYGLAIVYMQQDKYYDALQEFQIAIENSSSSKKEAETGDFYRENSQAAIISILEQVDKIPVNTRIKIQDFKAEVFKAIKMLPQEQSVARLKASLDRETKIGAFFWSPEQSNWVDWKHGSLEAIVAALKTSGNFVNIAAPAASVAPTNRFSLSSLGSFLFKPKAPATPQSASTPGSGEMKSLPLTSNEG